MNRSKSKGVGCKALATLTGWIYVVNLPGFKAPFHGDRQSALNSGSTECIFQISNFVSMDTSHGSSAPVTYLWSAPDTTFYFIFLRFKWLSTEGVVYPKNVSFHNIFLVFFWTNMEAWWQVPSASSVLCVKWNVASRDKNLNDGWSLYFHFDFG